MQSKGGWTIYGIKKDHNTFKTIKSRPESNTRAFCNTKFSYQLLSGYHDDTSAPE